jgi:hypothetical protein
MGNSHAVLERPATAHRRRARLPTDAHRSGRDVPSGHHPPLRTRLSPIDHQPPHRRLGQIFDDTTVAIAILDRLLHHASVIPINGDSYRMRAHRDAINALRPAITGGEKA